MKIVTSWDDASHHDIRLAELLLKYNLPATFYVPNCCELSDEQIRWLDSKGFTIAGHTVNHPQDLKKLSHPDLAFEIESNKQYLEKIIGREITKFCYPRGRYNKQVIEAVKRAGYEEARITKLFRLLKSKEPFQTGTTIHIFQRPEYDGVDWFKVAKEYLEIARNTENSIFHIWGHSNEIHRDNNWEKLEELFKLL